MSVTNSSILRNREERTVVLLLVLMKPTTREILEIFHILDLIKDRKPLVRYHRVRYDKETSTTQSHETYHGTAKVESY